MPLLPMLKGGEVIAALERAGFEAVRQRGSHVRLKHADGRVATVPVHAGQEIGRGLLGKILYDTELSSQHFAQLLRG